MAGNGTRRSSGAARSELPDEDPVALLDAIVDNIPASIFLKEARTLSFVRLNRGHEELTGLPSDAMIGRTDHDFFSPEEATFFQQKDRETLESGLVVDIPEEPIHTLYGVRWLHTRKITVRDAEGRPTHLLGISTDITEAKRIREELVEAHLLLEQRVEERTAELRREIEDRKRTEEALRVSEERFRLAAEAVGGIIYELNPTTGRATRSQGLLEVLGYEPTVVSPERAWWMEQVHPEDRERLRAAFERPEEWPAGRLRIEYRIRHADGRWVWLEERSLAHTNGEGRICVTGCRVDVSERVRAAESVRASEADARQRHQELQAIYDATPLGMCLLDRDLRFLRLNDRMAELNGMPTGDHIGKLVGEVVPDLAEQTRSIGCRILETGEPAIDVEVTGETPAQPGVRRTWLASWYPQIDAERRTTGVNVVVQEITARKQTECLLLEQTRLLEMIASGCALDQCFASICNTVAMLTPGTRASITLTGPEAPGAAHGPTRHPTACHESPVLGANGQRLGALALCFESPRRATEWELRLVAFGTHVASIAIERDRAVAALHESEVLFRTLGEAVGDLLW